MKRGRQVIQGPSTQLLADMGHPGVTTYLSGRLPFDSVRGLRRLLLIRFRGLHLAGLKNVVGEVAAVSSISQLSHKAIHDTVLGPLDILSDVLYADAAAVLKLVLPLVPSVKDTLEIIDFEGQVELFCSCFVNPPGVKTHTRFEERKVARLCHRDCGHNSGPGAMTHLRAT